MAVITYVNFDLLIDRTNDGYRVLVVDSPAGQSSVGFILPFSRQELDTLLPTRSIAKSADKDIGAKLFELVFNGDVRITFLRSFDLAQRENFGLRIRLRLANVPELADLPWEYLYDQTSNRFLGLSTQTPIVRYFDFPEPLAIFSTALPLNILVMIASPTDCQPLDVEAEWHNLQTALSSLVSRRLIQLTRMIRSTLSELQESLRRESYHVFLYIGHRGFDPTIQEEVLLLEDEMGKMRLIEGNIISRLLSDQRSLRLVHLNSRSGRLEHNRSVGSIALRLTQQGIAAVLDIPYEVSDASNIYFLDTFYGALVDGYPIDAALSEARKAISMLSMTEWGIPVLYTRSPNGQLFDIQSLTVERLERASQEAQKAVEAAQIRRLEQDANKLERVNSVEDILAAYRKVAADDLTDPISALLRRFSRISQDVEAALRQESSYNQRQTLSTVEDRLDSLFLELSRSSEAYAVRFAPITAQWRKIVADYNRELADAAEIRQEIDSPYMTGIPLTDQQAIFVGRTEISVRIEQLLADRRRPPLLLYGQRRMGKTSLLLNLGRMLRSTIVPFFIDLQGPASLAQDHAGFLFNLAKAMSDAAKTRSEIFFPLLSRATFSQDPFTRFDEWLDQVEKSLGQNTALLLFDEFEALDYALTTGRLDATLVLGMLRHLIQHRPRFKVLLAGSHTVDELQRWSSYLINVQVVKIGYLKETEARQLVEHPVEDFSLRYDPAASKRVLDLTRGHPFLVQLLCEEIVALKNEQEPALRRRARLMDVELAIPEALDHGRLFFNDIQQNQIDKVGADLLIYLAAHGAGAVLSRHALEKRWLQEKGFEQTFGLLLQRDLIEPAGNGYRFQVELIRRWFAQQSGSATAPVSPSLLKRLTQGLFAR